MLKFKANVNDFGFCLQSPAEIAGLLYCDFVFFAVEKSNFICYNKHIKNYGHILRCYNISVCRLVTEAFR